MAQLDHPLHAQEPKGPLIYIVGTPIGNLKDMTFRAVQALKSSDIIAAEDTRITRKLTSHFQLGNKPLVSLYDQIEEKKSKVLIEQVLQDSAILSYVSDAGTPCISDPGFHLINEALKSGIKVVPIPGVSALTTLVSVSKLPRHRIYFIGFFPQKKTLVKTEICSWEKIDGAIVFFESAMRILQTLRKIEEGYSYALVCVGRELTKKFEEIYQGTIQESIKWLESKENIKGEFTIMIHLEKTVRACEKEILREKIKKEASYLIKKDLSHKDLLEFFSDKGLSKKELYQLLLELKIHTATDS